MTRASAISFSCLKHLVLLWPQLAPQPLVHTDFVLQMFWQNPSQNMSEHVKTCQNDEIWQHHTASRVCQSLPHLSVYWPSHHDYAVGSHIGHWKHIVKMWTLCHITTVSEKKNGACCVPHPSQSFGVSRCDHWSISFLQVCECQVPPTASHELWSEQSHLTSITSSEAGGDTVTCRALWHVLPFLMPGKDPRISHGGFRQNMFTPHLASASVQCELVKTYCWKLKIDQMFGLVRSFPRCMPWELLQEFQLGFGDVFSWSFRSLAHVICLYNIYNMYIYIYIVPIKYLYSIYIISTISTAKQWIQSFLSLFHSLSLQKASPLQGTSAHLRGSHPGPGMWRP